jgi:hypothetical protein
VLDFVGVYRRSSAAGMPLGFGVIRVYLRLSAAESGLEFGVDLIGGLE